jgi:hypothetical protein
VRGTARGGSMRAHRPASSPAAASVVIGSASRAVCGERHDRASCSPGERKPPPFAAAAMLGSDAIPVGSQPTTGQDGVACSGASPIPLALRPGEQRNSQTTNRKRSIPSLCFADARQRAIIRMHEVILDPWRGYAARRRHAVQGIPGCSAGRRGRATTFADRVLRSEGSAH